MAPDIETILRYLRIRGESAPELRARVESRAVRLAESLTPRRVWRAFPLRRTSGGLSLGGELTLPGTLAERMLGGCDTAVLLCCTLGLDFERQLRSLERRDMGEAVILDACGSAWVESGCDQAEKELAELFAPRFLTDRFSPGYGDLPLSLQPSVLALLDAERRLGVHVSESFLMTPSKTVTAVLGVSDTPQPARIRGCAFCVMRGKCEYRNSHAGCGNAANESAAFNIREE